MNQLPSFSAAIASQDELVEQLQRWCHINSGTFHLPGVIEMREALIEDFRFIDDSPETIELASALEVDRHGKEVEVPLAPAVRWTRRLDRPRTVFLCIHIDTVYGPDHPFQACQWLADHAAAPRVLNGPGVADAKGGLLVLMHGLHLFEQLSPHASKIGWEVFINTDEEIGSPGSASYFRERARQHSIGLLFEPTLPDGTMVSQRKGSGNLACVVRGRAAHAGREFELGRNAIVELSRLVESFARINQEREGVTLNVGRIEGGGPVNVVPDLAIARLNARISTEEDGQWLMKRLETILSEADQAATLRKEDGLHRQLHGGLTSPPKIPDQAVLDLQLRIEQAAEATKQPVQWRATGGTCDGNKLFAYGLPNVDTLGVRGGAIHSSDEFVIPSSIGERAILLATLLHQFASESH